jgi:alanine-glyoxylate transaminase / serine-glyoxylate transaminase / serine-pyruvate transaminase
VQAIELLAADPARVSNPVSAILVRDGHDANALRKVALESFNLSLGGGLGPLAGPVFRTGRTSDLNEAMLLGALATTELAMKLCGIPHHAGGVEAAIGANWLAHYHLRRIEPQQPCEVIKKGTNHSGRGQSSLEE